jgi:hypothetical protein
LRFGTCTNWGRGICQKSNNLTQKRRRSKGGGEGEEEAKGEAKRGAKGEAKGEAETTVRA